MTAYREVWVECDRCDRPFGHGSGHRTQGAVVADAREDGWVERRELRYGTVPTVTHYCPDCKDKP